MAAFVPYCYQPLSSPRQIRLLEVSHAFDEDANLSGTLRVTDLDAEDTLPYVALSYTWGQPNFTESLVLDGNRVLNITPNLAAALRRFRYASALKWIWVDAICINQQDDADKNAQIPLMAEIYRGASRVMVWLGDRIEDAELLQSIKRLEKEGKAMPCLLLQGDDSTTIETHPLSNLGELRYFTRRWIIQEIALNPNVVLCCRNIELPLPQLVGFINTRCMDSGVQNIRLLCDLWLETAMLAIRPRTPLNERLNDVGISPYDLDLLGNRDIASLMEEYSHYDCADGRGRISALLGLSTDACSDFRVDYRDSVAEVFLKFAEFLGNRGHMTWLLHHSLKRKDNAESITLPSWVPDWTIAVREHNSLSRRAQDLHYVKRPCSIRASSIPGIHLLTAAFLHPLPTTEICLDIVWKSAVFSSETTLDDRIASVLVELWPFIFMRYGGNARSHRISMWYDLLAQVTMVFEGELLPIGATVPLDDLPTFDKEEGLDFQEVKNYVKPWLRDMFGLQVAEPSSVECLVFCQASADWQFGDTCGVGGLSSAQSRPVEVGQKVLLADLGWFDDPVISVKSGRDGFMACRHIVRELPMPKGLNAAESSEGIGNVSSHGSPSGSPGLASIPTFVYEFVGACVPFNFFRWNDQDLDNDRSSTESGTSSPLSHTADFRYRSYGETLYKDVYEDTWSIWIK